MQWISRVQYVEHARNAGADILKGTGQWLLRHEKFQTLRNSLTSQILWLRGDPGTGKTKLTHIVLDALNTLEKNTPIAYFFCNRNENERRDALTIVRTLLKQLSLHSDRTMMPLVTEYENQEIMGFPGGPPGLERCEELIIEILRRSGRIFIVIDALDECYEDSIDELLELLHNISTSPEGEVKCFVSSRNHDDIILQLEDVPNHYIQPENNQEDIERVIEWKLDMSIKRKYLLRGNVSPDLKQHIMRTLSRKAQGM